MTRREALTCIAAAAMLLLAAGSSWAKSQARSEKARASTAQVEAGSKSAKTKVAKVDKAGAKQRAAAPADDSVPPPPPVVKKRVDPLDAALMQAMATTDLPRKEAKQFKATSGAKPQGIGSLGRLAQRADSMSLVARHRHRARPKTEEVVRMDVQPLDPRVVRKLMATKTPQLHYCHERAAGPGNAPTGAVTVRFVVEPKGSVSSVEVHAGSGNGRELERCMKRRIRSWRFPAADAPTVVDFPLVFASADRH